VVQQTPAASPLPSIITRQLAVSCRTKGPQGLRWALLALGVAAVLSTARPAWAQTCGLCGDVNGDGVTDIVDALFIAQLTVGLRTTLPCPQQADVNQMNGTDIVDALFIAQLTVGLRTSLSCAAPLSLTVTSPQPLAVFTTSPVSVSGTFSGQAAVTCNGQAATLAGNTFSASVPLSQAENVITCLATDLDNMVASASVSVTLDNVAPILVIDSPDASAVTPLSQVDVTGVVNDVVAGVNAAPPVVRVNGALAAVSNRTFVVTNVSLKPGPNVLTAVGTDSAGNVGQTAITVTRQDLAGQRIRLVSGNGQGGPVSTVLPDPLVVELVDSEGSLVPDRAVSFMVTRGNGTLTGAPGNGQVFVVSTDANGRAAAQFVLGMNAGQGSHRVTATATGFVGQADFCASATPSPADRIVVISGDNQLGAVNEQLPLPLIAMVVDLEGNPAADVPVTFSVLDGGGTLGTAMANTGPDGKVATTLRLGAMPGVNNNRVRATFPGLTGLPAIFTATGKIAGQAADTSVSGVVVDNSDVPIPQAMALISGTTLSAVADADGRFRINGVPVGPIRLLIDGSTTTRPGVWPTLEYNLVTVAGQNNTVGGPIRLPVLDEGSSQIAGGPTDVTLTLSDVPGVSLTVLANSATFPGGAHTGRLTLTQVHFDKVPMAPPNGSQFVLAWTIQPPGVQFDPPARITVPNNGMPPGTLVDMFSFDHDLGVFVVIGTASVSADGSIIKSDPGFGIRKTGWGGCAPPPPPTTCTPKCPNPVDGDCTQTTYNLVILDQQTCSYECRPQVMNKADGTMCMDDGKSCTTDKCKAGMCDHMLRGSPCGSNGATTITDVHMFNMLPASMSGPSDATPKSPTFTGDVCVDEGAGVWRYRVQTFRADGTVRVSGTPSANTPNPAVGGNITATNFCDAATMLAGYSTRRQKGPRWHQTQASVDHENHHWNNDWIRDSVVPNWTSPDGETRMESRTVGCSAAADASAARNALTPQVTTDFQSAVAKMRAHWATIVPQFSAGHLPAYQVGQGVLTPIVGSIVSFAQAQGFCNDNNACTSDTVVAPAASSSTAVASASNCCRYVPAPNGTPCGPGKVCNAGVCM